MHEPIHYPSYKTFDVADCSTHTTTINSISNVSDNQEEIATGIC